jgi:hypothetical protein
MQKNEIILNSVLAVSEGRNLFDLDDVKKQNTNDRDLNSESVGFTPVEKPLSFTDGLITAGGIFFLITVGYIILRKQPQPRVLKIYSVFQNLLIIATILFAFWMFRYDVTSGIPIRCLDRWQGVVGSCP